MKTIAIVNQKGGCGKTTTAVNLAAALALSENRVLIVDLDPQGHSTLGFGCVPDALNKTVYDCLTDPQVLMVDAALRTNVKGLDLIPSNILLSGIEFKLAQLQGREYVLSQQLKRLNANYDICVIDCSPSLNLLTLNALAASTDVIIPVQTQYYALEGLSNLLNTIRLVQKHLNPHLKVEGILLTMYDKRLNLSKQVSDEVKSYFQSKVFDTCIHRNVRLGEAPSHGKPIVLFDAVSIGCENYMSLAKEILNNGKETFRKGT